MSQNLTTADKAKLTHLSRAGDIYARGYEDHEAFIASLKVGQTGNVIRARVASTTNLGSLSGLSAIDGVTPVDGDVLLIKDQTDTTQRDLYVAHVGAWTRLVDGEGSTILKDGLIVVVKEGGQANSLFLQTTSDPIVIGTTHIAFVQLNVTSLATSLLAITHGNGASLVGIEDALGLFPGAPNTVESALVTLIKGAATPLADPGTGVAIPVTRSANIGIITAGAETNTLAIPGFIGQRLILSCDTHVGGDRVITSAQRINAAGNTIMTFSAAGKVIVLEAVKIAGVLRWQVTANDGVTLS